MPKGWCDIQKTVAPRSGTVTQSPFFLSIKATLQKVATIHKRKSCALHMGEMRAWNAPELHFGEQHGQETGKVKSLPHNHERHVQGYKQYITDVFQELRNAVLAGVCT